MNKQDNRLGLSVVATLVAGIALVYTLIMFPQIIFAVAGISFIFIINLVDLFCADDNAVRFL